jgi:hypothetical protein
MLGRGGATEHAEEARAFAAQVLDETSQIAKVRFADAAGNFMLVTRDAKGKVIARRQDPNDDYDARG